MAAEEPVQHRLRQLRIPGGFADTNRRIAVLNQKTDCGRQFQMRHRNNVGTGPANHRARRNHFRFKRHVAAVEHFLHGFGKFQSYRAVFAVDAGERHRRVGRIQWPLRVA